jgi:cytochrome c peroxidase
MRCSTYGVAACAVMLALVAGCRKAGTPEQTQAGATDLIVPAGLFAALPTTPPVLADNPLTPEKVALGRMLFFEPRLSKSWLISCNTCHNIGLGGVDLLETSIGHGWQKGPRNAPTVLNSVLNIAQFWDGRAKDLEEQAKGPVQASVEMSSTPDHVVATLKSIPEYVEGFHRAFPNEEDPVTFDNMARAIEAFEATLLTPNAPFDRYLGGDRAALAADQTAGLRLFVAKGCAGCHGGVNVGGAGYFPFGVVETPGADVRPPADKGRFTVTRSPGDESVFKAPSLRNVALTPPYFHSGRVQRLERAVAIMGAAQLGATLDSAETQAIVAFLHSLTGDQPVESYPILPPQTDATPLPDVRVQAPAAGTGR